MTPVCVSQTLPVRECLISAHKALGISDFGFWNTDIQSVISTQAFTKQSKTKQSTHLQDPDYF